ncbi:hypothetical protein AMTRI_Chr04g190650 [Amborella trichopoda]
MGRSPCCEKVGLKKGPWTPEEDQKLLAYIEEHGHGSWRALPVKAGLLRCGKSCRLRWTNYLRPDIKRGKFSLQEEQTIIQLHALLGNRWSAIATHLPRRTDNEIKNYWNTHLKKRLAKMGIDPVTHKPKTDALCLVDGQSKNAATLSHMAQWESARLEAEARLVRESKLRSASTNHSNSNNNKNNYSKLLQPLSFSATQIQQQQPKDCSGLPLCLDVLKVWQGGWQNKIMRCNGQDLAMLESPTSTLSFGGDNNSSLPNPAAVGFGGENPAAGNEFVENQMMLGPSDEKEEYLPSLCDQDEGLKCGGVYSFLQQALRRSSSQNFPLTANEEEEKEEVTRKLAGNRLEKVDGLFTSLQDMVFPADNSGDFKAGSGFNMEGFMSGDLLVVLADAHSEPENRLQSSNDQISGENARANTTEEDHKSYWNNIFNLVNSPPAASPIF